jgi:hypothetical protein
MVDRVASAVASGADARNLEEGKPLTGAPPIARANSHFSLDYNENLNEAQIKRDFIKKVYGLLSAQLLITGGVAAAVFYAYYDPNADIQLVKKPLIDFFLGSLGGKILNVIVLIAFVICIHVWKSSFPANLLLLFGFSAWLGLEIGCIIFVVSAAGQFQAVLCALGTTAALFAALSLYAAFSKTDFSFLGAFLFVALIANLLLGFIAYALGLSLVAWLSNVFGVLIFSGYVLYDTDQIVNKVTLETADMGEAVVGALELYLDIVNLFLYLLALFLDR